MTKLKYILSGKKYSPEEFANNNPLKNTIPKKYLLKKPRTQWEKIKACRQSSLRYYYNHKTKCSERNRIWGLKNPQKVKAYKRKSFARWYSKKKNKKHMVDYMKKYYSLNKDKHLSRCMTYRLKEFISNKNCKCCGNIGKQIHHEIYPRTVQEMIRKTFPDNVRDYSRK